MATLSRWRFFSALLGENNMKLLPIIFGLAMTVAGATEPAMPPITPDEERRSAAIKARIEAEEHAKEAATAEMATCHCADQCSAMWAQAAPALELASGMRIRLASESLLETYPTHNAGALTGTVTKIAVGAHAYIIQADFQTWAPGQGDLVEIATKIFNLEIHGAANMVPCPAPK